MITLDVILSFYLFKVLYEVSQIQEDEQSSNFVGSFLFHLSSANTKTIFLISTLCFLIAINSPMNNFSDNNVIHVLVNSAAVVIPYAFIKVFVVVACFMLIEVGTKP
jgi:hypothetical protein